MEYDENETIDTEQMVKLIAMDTKVAMVARLVLGVDELTEESIKIFSSKKAFAKSAHIETCGLENMDIEKLTRKDKERKGG